MKSKFTFMFASLMIISLTSPVLGQVSIEREKCLGGSNYENAFSIIQTSDGGYAFVGETLSTDSIFTDNTEGMEGLFVIKTDALFNIEWRKVLGSSSFDFANCIKQTPDGGYLIGGFFHENDGDAAGSYGGDSWLIKLNPSGDMEWKKFYGGSGNELIGAMEIKSDGYIFAASTTSMSNDHDVVFNHSDLNTISTDLWIVKVSLSGNHNIIWQKSIGGTNQEEPVSMISSDDGGNIILFNTYSNDGDIVGHHGGWDYGLAKIDASGNTQWIKCYGGLLNDEAKSITKTSDGGFLITGSTNSYDGIFIENVENMDPTAVVLKIDAIGNIEWTRCIGGSYPDGAAYGIQTQDGGYMIFGFTDSNNGDASGNLGSSDVWIVKLNATGTILWQRCFGGSSGETANIALQSADNGFVIAGMTKSTDGDISSNNNGYFDIWLVKFSPDISSVQTTLSDKTSIVYPNPNNGIISLSLPSNFEKIEIFDPQGKLVQSIKTIQNSIDFSGYAPGVYTLKLSTKNEVKTEKIVIQ